MSHPTVTVRIRDVLAQAQRRAVQLGRTQQLEIGEDLFIRIGPGGRKFLLFGLDAEPERSAAEAIAAALGLKDPQYGWHQGATLRSLTVVEAGADEAEGGEQRAELQSREAEGEGGEERKADSEGP